MDGPLIQSLGRSISFRQFQTRRSSQSEKSEPSLAPMTLSKKLSRARRYGSIITAQEPYLNELTNMIHRKLQNRQQPTRLPNKRPIKSDHIRRITKLQIKALLLQLDDTLLKSLVLNPSEGKESNIA